ncbi:PIG-L family deacetylase [Cellulomonas sp. KRMCY2]|uniref:PIG-L family deacetylase n=1 Tax=Cellulomonas sp. KRMCY2 TaxID=1304865 RepID=UPI00045E8615|nr:PIG-L family deacetylase [Cellulomonas sp. KRMCY2]
MPAEGCLLAVHAHPDDETLSTGALLATWSQAGRPVTVVTCTRGERGEVIGDELAHLEGDGPALAAHREGELADALRALGVSDHLFLDQVASSDVETSAARYTDSGMAWAGVGRAGPAAALPAGAFVAADLDAAAVRLAAVIRDRRPDVVVGYEPGGGYGHPDHITAHRVVQRAVVLAELGELAGAEPFRVPVVLWAVLDAQLLRAGYAALAPLAHDRLVGPDPTGPLPAGAVEPEVVDVRVDVRPVVDRVLGALRAHRTQVHAVRAHGAGPLLGSLALSNDVLAPLLAVETYRYAVGREHGPVSWPVGVAAREGS